MGYTKIKPVKHDLGRVLTYTMNDEKAFYHNRLLVSGVSCDAKSPEQVYQQFMNTRKGYGKKSPRLAYHAIQSFADYDNVTPEIAHEIGVKMAQELWSDRFEVVVSTHVDKKHFHNHFVINAVSWADGRMFHESNEDYERLIRGVSDRLCREYGLTVIDNPKRNRYKTYNEFHTEGNSPPTIHTLIYADMDNALEMAANLDDFYRRLEMMGYQIKRYGINGQPLRHPAIKPPTDADGKEHKFFRLSSFAPGYTEEDIVRRLEDKAKGRPYQVRPPAEPNVDAKHRKNRSSTRAGTARQSVSQAAPEQTGTAQPINEEKTNEVGVKWYHIWDRQVHRGKAEPWDNIYMYDGVWLPRSVIFMRTNLYHSYFRRRTNWYGLRKTFTMMVYLLKSVQRTSYPQYPSHEIRREAARLDQYSEEALLLHRYKIDTMQDLLKRYDVINDGIREVNKNRKRLRDLIKAQPSDEEAAPLKAELEEYKALAKQLYHERALLKDIAEHSNVAAQFVQHEKERAQSQEVHQTAERNQARQQHYAKSSERKNDHEL